jgi:type II secretory pathway component PulJ
MSPSWAKRHGYALVEMVLAIGAVAIVIGLCAGMLHVLLRLDRTARSHLVETTTIGRLARQFRQDVHAAHDANRGATGNGAAAKLELVLSGDRSIIYEMRDGSLLRREHHGNTAGRLETYRLPFCREGVFTMHTQDGKVWVQLRLRRGPESGVASGASGPRQDLAIDARVGRDLDRFSVRPKSEDETP